MTRDRATTSFLDAAGCLRTVFAAAIVLTREEAADLRWRAIHGDAAARERLTLAGLRFAAKIAWRFHRSTGLDASECISDATLACVRCADEFDPTRGTLLNFVEQAVRYALISLLRKKRSPTLAMNDPAWEAAGDDWKDEQERRRTAVDVRAAIDTLPGRLRQIAAWSHLERLTGAEIAQRIGRSRELARQLLNRADDALRRSLHDFDEHESPDADRPQFSPDRRSRPAIRSAGFAAGADVAVRGDAA